MTALWQPVDADNSSTQIELRFGLGLDPFLEKRSCWNLSSGLHVEIYESGKEAPNLIFLPGMGTYVELYAELLHHIHDSGINVIAIDPPGHGYSAGNRGAFQVVPFCTQVSEVIDQLEKEFSGEWSIYGYSMGALCAVALAERDDRIISVLCGTLLMTEYPPDMAHMMGWSWTSVSAFMFPTMTVPLKTFVDFEQLLGHHPAGALINSDPRIIFDYPLSTLASLFTHRSQLTKAQYPFRLSIIQGSKDEVLSLSYAQEIKAKLVHPVNLVVLLEQGHMLPWDEPKGLAQTVLELLKGELIAS